MSHPLTGCFLKLDRAGTHLHALKEAIDRLIGPDPDRLLSEFDSDSGEYIFRAQRDMRTPTEWSAIVGGVVHNVSAALDYLACELVIINGGTLTTSTAFPIFQEQVRYDSDAPKKIRGIHPRAQAIIKLLQPFQTPPSQAHPSEHPLARLYSLEQRDKHRALNLTTNAASVRLRGFLSPLYAPPGPFDFPFGPHERGAVLCRITGVPSEPEMNMQLDVAHQVVFDKDGPAATRHVLRTLTRIKRHVENVVIPPFRQFF